MHQSHSTASTSREAGFEWTLSSEYGRADSIQISSLNSGNPSAVENQQLKILNFFIFLCKLFLRSFGSIVVNSFKDFDFAACMA
jgi:hypothetical protein